MPGKTSNASVTNQSSAINCVLAADFAAFASKMDVVTANVNSSGNQLFELATSERSDLFISGLGFIPFVCP